MLRFMLSATLTAVLACPSLATDVPCEKATARRAVAARRCLAVCEAGGPTRRCDPASPDRGLGRCLRRAERKTRDAVERACGAPSGFCGDGIVGEAERCDESAPGNGGCPEGSRCVACTSCGTVCGDGLVSGTERCDPAATPSGCAPAEQCVRCAACGPAVSLVSAEEDLTPCTDAVADRWTFDVEAGTAVTVAVDTVDAATAAKLAFEGTCPATAFRAALGAPCAFPPPTGQACPVFTFVAPASGGCTLTVGVLHLDDGLAACTDPALARYRVSVGGTGLTLTGDDVSPGLQSDD